MPGLSCDLCPPGLGRALRLTGCPDVQEVLTAAMPGWPVTAVDAVGPVPPIRLHREEAGYRQHSPALDEALLLSTPVAAASSLVADLAEAFFASHRELVGLHCGAVEIAGRLVLFPESHRAGKSTLTAALAATGQRVFGDDVLALTPAGEGMALGIAPRLRLPLPSSLAPELHAFAGRHAGPQDGRYRFLALPDGQLARHGERLPLGALVLLERDDAVREPELIDLAPGEGLLQLLCQNFAHDRPSETLMARFLPLMETLPCRLLRYGEPLAAARRLLAESQVSGGGPAASLTVHRAVKRGVSPPVAAGIHWRANASVRDFPLGDELFLIQLPGGAIHRLNATGRLAWGLLSEEAMSAEELAGLLAEHYAMASRETIETDLRALLGEMADAELVVPA